MKYTVHKLILNNDLDIDKIHNIDIKLNGDKIREALQEDIIICDQISLIDIFHFNLMFNDDNKYECGGFVVPRDHDCKKGYITTYKDETITLEYRSNKLEKILKFKFNKLNKIVFLLITLYE